MSTEGLTVTERHAMELSALLMADLSAIIGHGRTRAADMAEAAQRIHAIQHMVMSQAAARAHPHLYRLLGEADHGDTDPAAPVR